MRGIEYFDIDQLYPENCLQMLPDCRKGDGKVEGVPDDEEIM